MPLSRQQLALLGKLREEKHGYYKLAYTLTGSEREALEAVARMTLKVAENISALGEPEAFFAWSRQILVNACRDFWHNRGGTLSMEEVSLAQGAGDIPIEDELILRQYIHQLPQVHREILHLNFYLDYTYSDIAAILEIPEDTVNTCLQKAMETLGEQMGEV